MPQDPDAVARLFYLVLVLLALVSFFVAGSRRRLGTAIQQFLIWALIFAMAIIAYGFRDTLRSALFPAEVARVLEEAVELRRGSDGHFHATLEVNGTPIRFMVDTGATDVVLGARDAERAGIDLDALVYTGRAMTANGAVGVAPVRLRRVEFAGAAEENVPASVTAGALGTSLLGMSYLDRFSRIEIVGDRMVLTR